MRIRTPSSANASGAVSGSRPANSGKGSTLPGVFAGELSRQEQSDERYQEEINLLRTEIDQTGERLSEEPTLQNFTRFREALSRLARRITAEAYRLEKFGGTPQNPRYFEQITVINHEADRLYRLIIQEQHDNLAITARVIGIKGMVVDLIT